MKSFGSACWALTSVLVMGCSGLASNANAGAVGPDQHLAAAIAPVADPFRQALVDGYKALVAQSAAAGLDYGSVALYYHRAADAASGKPIPLENPNDWRLAAKDRDEAMAMRAALTERIAASKEANPREAAAQQIRYDRWINALSEGKSAQAAATKPTLETLTAAE